MVTKVTTEKSFLWPLWPLVAWTHTSLSTFCCWFLWGGNRTTKSLKADDTWWKKGDNFSWIFKYFSDIFTPIHPPVNIHKFPAAIVVCVWRVVMDTKWDTSVVQLKVRPGWFIKRWNEGDVSIVGKIGCWEGHVTDRERFLTCLSHTLTESQWRSSNVKVTLMGRL